MIEIDGSFGEGGGQILRTATALAAIKKIPCRIFNIRKGRPNPGLQTQHLLGLRALAELCNGKLEGDYLNSTEIRFYPGEIKSKDLTVKIETAGSITLCLQTLLPVALFSKNPIKISFKGGGTDVPFSPTIDYFRYVFLKILEKMGARVEINVIKRGYYPSGGGILDAKVYPSKLKPLVLTEKGGFKKILAISGAAESLKSRKVSERQLMGAREVLHKLKLPMEERIEYYSTDCPGSQIFIGAFFENTVLGVDELGKLGKRAEDVGKECAFQLLEEEKSKACLDRFLTDQILIYLALAKGKSQVRISKLTLHAQTNIKIIEKFLNGKFEIKNNILSWIPSREK
jgi:RNA 3'-phosphate cyclase